MNRIFLILVISLFAFSGIGFSNVNEIQPENAKIICDTTSAACSSCSVVMGDSGETPIIPALIIIILITGFFYFQFKKKYIIISGAALLVAFSYLYINKKGLSDSENLVNCDTTQSNVYFEPGNDFIDMEKAGADKLTLNEDEFVTVGDDFSSMDNESKSMDDEFSSVGDEFTSLEENDESMDDSEFSTSDLDEFQSVSDDEFSTSGLDEFQSVTDDEFSSGGNEFSELSDNDDPVGLAPFEKKHIRTLLIILGVLIFIRIFKRYEKFRAIRPLFLLGGLVWLGFSVGGCPCMISSFHNFFLLLLGGDISWVWTLWFLGLIPVTYILGKVWCGWFCHLGALQEFVFSSTKIEKLKTPKAQKIIYNIQYAVFAILILQIVITKTNIFIHYDPFKVAFNLFSANRLGYVLLVILLLSTLFVYRPFCRMFCPVGLVLDWVQLIPGARKISQTENCNDCIKCTKVCKPNTIQIKDKKTHVKSSGCIACGDCIDSCNKDAIGFTKRRLPKVRNTKSQKKII